MKMQGRCDTHLRHTRDEVQLVDTETIANNEIWATCSKSSGDIYPPRSPSVRATIRSPYDAHKIWSKRETYLLQQSSESEYLQHYTHELLPYTTRSGTIELMT